MTHIKFNKLYVDTYFTQIRICRWNAAPLWYMQYVVCVKWFMFNVRYLFTTRFRTGRLTIQLHAINYRPKSRCERIAHQNSFAFGACIRWLFCRLLIYLSSLYIKIKCVCMCVRDNRYRSTWNFNHVHSNTTSRSVTSHSHEDFFFFFGSSHGQCPLDTYMWLTLHRKQRPHTRSRAHTWGDGVTASRTFVKLLPRNSTTWRS